MRKTILIPYIVSLDQSGHILVNCYKVVESTFLSVIIDFESALPFSFNFVMHCGLQCSDDPVQLFATMAGGADGSDDPIRMTRSMAGGALTWMYCCRRQGVLW